MNYATVFEAVKLSAFTRLPASWSKKEKLSNVRDVIERLRLTSVSHVGVFFFFFLFCFVLFCFVLFYL